MAKRSSAAYAALGLLGIRDWTPYELVRHMTRSHIHFVWPRAESKIYEEPRRLTEAGWARSRVDPRRPRRTVYRITAAGRRALQQWLSEPPTPALFESEGALKVLFSEQGNKEGLLATLAAIRATELNELRTALHLLDDVLSDGPPFPNRAHVTSTVSELPVRVRMAVLDWVAWAEARVKEWPPDIASADDEMRAEADEIWRAARTAIAERLDDLPQSANHATPAIGR